MSSIAVVTDSDASLTAALARRYGIQVVPINIHFGQETLRSGVDIDDAALFARVDREGKLPTTSAPSPGEFKEAFETVFAGGAEAVVCICVSSEISATYQSALTACDLLPGRQIIVLDSRSVSMGQGFMALAAAREAGRDALLQEVVAAAESVRDRVFVYGALATLKYLAMSGRVGHVAAGLGNLLNVKPIVTLIDGKLEMLERVRSRQRSLERLIELTQESLHGGALEELAVLHVAAPDELAGFQREICATLTCPGDLVVTEFSPGLSVHTGAGLIAVAGVRK
jgi:DegV family protein with EDD domain